MKELQFFFLNHNISVREFCKQTGLDYHTLIKIKNGQLKPSANFLQRVKEGIELFE